MDIAGMRMFLLGKLEPSTSMRKTQRKLPAWNSSGISPASFDETGEYIPIKSPDITMKNHH